MATLRPATPPRVRPDAFCPSSPPMKPMKRRDFDDVCSTAAPSPAMTDLTSPWGTPFQGSISPYSGGFGSTSPWTALDAGMPGKLQHKSPWSSVPAVDFTSWSMHDLAGNYFMELNDMQGLGAPPPVPTGACGAVEVLGACGDEMGSVDTVSSASSSRWTEDKAVEAPDLLTPRTTLPTSPPSTPPSTPRKERPGSPGSPPRAPKESALPPLLGALCSDSEEQVREALREDPQAAMLPFWDNDVSPPLCSAVRHGCSVAIVRLLLEHNADVDMVDSRGQAPLALLAATPCPARQVGWEAFLPTQGRDHLHVPAGGMPWLPPDLGELPGEDPEAALLNWDQDEREQLQRTEAVAQALVDAGADPLAADATGKRPVDLARASGNDHLVRLWLRHFELDPVREEAGIFGEGLWGSPADFAALPRDAHGWDLMPPFDPLLQAPLPVGRPSAGALAGGA